jgi:RNA polymerase sigma factor (sigma-70 family)
VTTRKDGAVLRQLSTLLNIGAIRELTDGQLLEKFSSGRGDVRELAFEALVERHGGMVLRVCRAQLVDPHDIQDAFQATFLILLKKARALWVRDSLGPWLHQVALRTAVCARSAAARRRRYECRAAERAANLDPRDDPAGSELERELHAAIDLLPDCYRVPIVLCDLEGYTCEEAARRMGRPVGTVKSWRYRGRQRLRDRLLRLGLAPSAGLAAALTAQVAHAAVSRLMAADTVCVSVRRLSDLVTAGEVPASVHTLVKGVLKTMLLGKLRAIATAAVALAFLTTGLGAVVWAISEEPSTAVDGERSEAPRPPVVEQAYRKFRAPDKLGEPWRLSLREAIRIGLDTSECWRVIAWGAQAIPVGGFEPTPLNAGTSGGVASSLRGTPGVNGMRCKIAPVNPAVDPQRFKAEVMAHLRSIEQQYWILAQAHVQLRSSEKAVDMAREIVKREQTDLEVGRGTIADVAEASQRLQQFELDLVTRTSDVITTEGRLRFLLGLPQTAGGRIIPVTPPTEAQLEPDWDVSLAAMLANQPDVVRARALVKEAEGDTAGDRRLQLEQRKASLQQVVHQATHSMARFFLEIDANYKQFKAASRLRAAASDRLNQQRAYYEEGRITIDRFMDSVSQYASALATEAQYKTTYNIAIVALEEAKGTLLEYYEISVGEGPKPTVALSAGRQGVAVAAPASFVPAALIPAPPTSVSAAPIAPPPFGPGPPALAAKLTTSPFDAGAPQPVQEMTPQAGVSGKTLSFQLSVKIGTTPVEIRGSFTVSPGQKLDPPGIP